MPPDLATNALRRKRLLAKLRGQPEANSAAYDAVVTLNEVNDRHGTGVLIQRIYPDHSHVVSVRSASHYGGEQAFGAIQLAIPDGCCSRADIYRWVLEMTDGLIIRRILVVPFENVELVVALALRDAYQAPLGLYVMDDHNVRASGISNALMSEAIEKSSARFAISSDMRDLYESKYRRRFWIAPPTVPREVRPVTTAAMPKGSAVVLGNIWGRSWLDALRKTVREAGLRVDWFANSPNGGWLDLNPAELLADGIRLHGPVPEADLPELLSGYEFALHPNGFDAVHGENSGVAALSLPTRIPLMLCASELPVIVLGDGSSTAARFVSYFGVGAACQYDSKALAAAIEAVRSSAWKASRSRSLERLRAIFQTADFGSWMSAAIDAGRPPSLVYERLTVAPQLAVSRFLPEPVSLGPWLHDFERVAAAMRLLSDHGYRPDFVIDVGASNGVWSDVVSTVFPESHYVLVEPLRNRYVTDEPEDAPPVRRRTLAEVAVASSEGAATLHVSSNLFGSSLIASAVDGADKVEEVTVPVTTLDVLARDAHLSGRGILKLDIQGGEAAAMAGAANVMPSIDVVVVEVTYDPPAGEAPSFTEIHALMEGLGFIYFDDVGEWREPRLGVLLQKDVMYVRKSSTIARLRKTG